MYIVVILVTISTIALYTPIFSGRQNNQRRKSYENKSKPTFSPPSGTPYAKGPTSTPPNVWPKPTATAINTPEPALIPEKIVTPEDFDTLLPH